MSQSKQINKGNLFFYVDEAESVDDRKCDNRAEQNEHEESFQRFPVAFMNFAHQISNVKPGILPQHCPHCGLRETAVGTLSRMIKENEPRIVIEWCQGCALIHYFHGYLLPRPVGSAEGRT